MIMILILTNDGCDKLQVIYGVFPLDSQTANHSQTTIKDNFSILKIISCSYECRGIVQKIK